MRYYFPVYLYLKKVCVFYSLNSYELTFRALSFTAIIQFLSHTFGEKLFGVSNFLLSMVILTTLTDAYYGVQKSKKKSKEYFELAQSLNYEENIKLSEKFAFDPKKLKFTFFKCFTLLMYLFVVKTFLENDFDNLAIGFTYEIIMKAPLAIFWYYDFKSIGDNAEYLHGKKAPIFKIAERIFEAKINKILK
jgi:hypothetical protein